jgi:hypothetical protein
VQRAGCHTHIHTHAHTHTHSTCAADGLAADEEVTGAGILQGKHRVSSDDDDDDDGGDDRHSAGQTQCKCACVCVYMCMCDFTSCVEGCIAHGLDEIDDTMYSQCQERAHEMKSRQHENISLQQHLKAGDSPQESKARGEDRQLVCRFSQKMRKTMHNYALNLSPSPTNIQE